MAVLLGAALITFPSLSSFGFGGGNDSFILLRVWPPPSLINLSTLAFSASVKPAFSFCLCSFVSFVSEVMVSPSMMPNSSLTMLALARVSCSLDSGLIRVASASALLALPLLLMQVKLMETLKRKPMLKKQML